MAWSDTTDPTTTSLDVPGPPYRHTYGAEYNKTTRICFGDNVRYGGLGFENITDDPSNDWLDIVDPQGYSILIEAGGCILQENEGRITIQPSDSLWNDSSDSTSASSDAT